MVYLGFVAKNFSAAFLIGRHYKNKNIQLKQIILNPLKLPKLPKIINKLNQHELNDPHTK